MRTFAIVAAVAVAASIAAPAMARPGQCYDAYGRPVGPVYDTDHPNYGHINRVIRRGGTCTGVSSTYEPNRRYRRDRYYYDPPRRRYRDYRNY